MNKWSIKQIGEIGKNSQCGYHTIADNDINVGMIDIWFGKYQCIKTPEEALKVAKLVEKAPEMYNLLKEVVSYLGDKSTWKEGEEIIGYKIESLIKAITT